MLFIFSLVSALLHANFKGNSSQCTSISSPCNYNAVYKQMSNGDTIIITDKLIFDPDHLDAFHNLSSKAFSIGTSLKGLNTIINGSLSKYYSPAFVSFESQYNISVEFFSFINFAASIIYCSGSTFFHIFNCNFHDNQIDNKQSILIFGSSCNAIVKYTNFSLLASHDASIISSNMSSILFDYCTFDKSFTFHSSKQIPLILSIQSQLKIMNSNIIQNQSPYSPFFLLKNMSSISIENTSFLSNQNTIIFHCKEANSILIKDSIFYNNMGNLIKNGRSHIVFDVYNTQFEQNFSPLLPFISIINSSANFTNNCAFISNSGHSSLLQFSGSSSSILFNEAKFIGNQNDDSIIKSLNVGKISIYSSKFNNNQNKNSVILGNNSKIIIDKSNFYKSWSLSVMTVFTEIHILNSIFDEIYGKTAISALNSRNSRIYNSTFKDNSLSLLIKMNGTVTLKKLHFNTYKDFALSKNLLKNCQNCVFLEEVIKEDQSVSFTSTFLMIVLPLIIFILIIFIFRKRLSYFWRKFTNRKILD